MKITLPVLNEFLKKNKLPSIRQLPDVSEDLRFIESHHDIRLIPEMEEFIAFMKEVGYVSEYRYRFSCTAKQVNRSMFVNISEPLYNVPSSVGTLVDDVLWNYERVHQEYSEECPFDLGLILFDVYEDGHEIIYINDLGEVRSYNYENDEDEDCTTLYASSQIEFINNLEVVDSENY